MYKSPNIVAPPSICKILVSIHSEGAFHGKTDFLKTSELTFSSPKAVLTLTEQKKGEFLSFLFKKSCFSPQVLFLEKMGTNSGFHFLLGLTAGSLEL